MYLLVALTGIIFLSAPSSARNSQHLYRHRVHEAGGYSFVRLSGCPHLNLQTCRCAYAADYHGLCAKEFFSIEEQYAAKLDNIWMEYQEVEGQLSQLAAQKIPFVELTVDGFPCVQHGCCQHSVLLRPHDSDLQVVSLAPQEYATELSKLVGWKPATILDGGGNIGMASAVFAFLFPEANIVTLEPEKENCLLAKFNTDTFPSVHVQCRGLWNSETSVTLRHGVDKQSWAWEVVETSADTPGATRTTTIQSLLQQYHLTGFDYVKLDIEGAEYAVLGKDADTSWIRNTSLLSIEIHGDHAPIDAVMEEYGMLASPCAEYVFYARPELHALLAKQ